MSSTSSGTTWHFIPEDRTLVRGIVSKTITKIDRPIFVFDSHLFI
jgi:hypothetical protein